MSSLFDRRPRWLLRLRLPKRHREPDPDPAASMALLREVLDRPLDPGYASAAEQREARGLPRSSGWRSPLLIVAAVVIGLLFAVAAHSLRQPEPAAAQTRVDLAERIRDGQSLVQEQQDALEEQEEEVEAIQDEALTADDDLAQRLQSAGESATATALEGQGIEVVLDDSDEVYAGSATGQEERVLAQDLQVLTNGLWARGAEAIAINDQRLSNLASIRFAGEAIVVNFESLTRPYTVTAIGPPEDLEDEVTNQDTGDYLQSLVDDYDIVLEVSAPEEVTVPAATRLTVREATAITPEEGS